MSDPGDEHRDQGYYFDTPKARPEPPSEEHLYWYPDWRGRWDLHDSIRLDMKDDEWTSHRYVRDTGRLWDMDELLEKAELTGTREVVEWLRETARDRSQ